MFKTRGNDLVSRFPAGSCGVPAYRSSGVVECCNNWDVVMRFCGGGSPIQSRRDTTLAAQLCVSLALFPHYLIVEVVNGRRAIFLALFMATVSILWCFAQLPEILRGMILPRSVVKYLSILESL